MTMEGLSDATSQASKTSTSYMSTEILWGSRFVQCIQINKEGTYVVVRKRFNETEEVTTPLCSASRLHEVNIFSVTFKKFSLFSLRSFKKRRVLQGFIVQAVFTVHR